MAGIVRQGTYSIVAFDPESDELGVALQSHWPAVGADCAWARAGVGAVATQSIIQPAYGVRGLDRIAQGESAPVALATLLAEDPLAAVRQVGTVDATGAVGTHTGADCIPCAGHAVDRHVSCQANMMLRDTVPAAMLTAYQDADGELAARLMAALEAAEREGGDVRGRQSAALLVVPAHGDPWETRFDLRVDDHDDPLVELQRLLHLGRAYALANAGDQLMGADRAVEAATLYRRAAEQAPDADELVFWAGLAVALDDLEAGARMVGRAATVNPDWLVLLDRLPRAFAPAGPAVRAALGRS